MGTLTKVKRRLKADRDFKKALVRSAKDEILIDLDGDGQADLALMDSIGDGDIDTLALDLTGDGEFNLYFHDSDANGLPDLVFIDEQGDGESIKVLGVGPEVEKRMIITAHEIMLMQDLAAYSAEKMNTALELLQKELEEAKQSLKASA